MHVINYADRYRKNIQWKGIRDKIFCKLNYYDWKEITLEKKFSQYEGSYNKIIQQLTSRTSTGIEMKRWISQWMYMSKMRSEFVRDLTDSIFLNFERYSIGYGSGEEEMRKQTDKFIKKGQLGGKIFQFQNFETQDYWNKQDEITKNFIAKEWIVYISENKNFITSDNPGFSFTHSKRNQLLNISPVYGDYNISISEFVVHCYPLTSKMCLCLKPFAWNAESTEEQISMEIHKQIQFQGVGDSMIEEINDCTRDTAHKMVIGNLKTDLERYIKKQENQTKR